MQLHIAEAYIMQSKDESEIIILGKSGTITLTGEFAKRFKLNYPAHFSGAVSPCDWEHPTVTADLSMQDFHLTAH